MNLNELIKDNQQSVKNIIKLITKEANEDLEQEVYVKVLKNAHNYKEQNSFRSWINTIAKNVSKDYLKSSYKKHRDTAVPEDEAVNSVKDKSTPESKFIKLDRQKKITNAVNSLKPKFREVIILCEVQGYQYEEAAKKLKCPIGTIKSRLYNAKKELSIQLKELM